MAREIGLAVRALVLTDREMQTALARRLGVGLTDVRAMEELVASPDVLGPVELGNRLGIRSASATVLVDRLGRRPATWSAAGTRTTGGGSPCI